ncbi:hypothetical protein ACIQ9R_36305 [Streptomyces sp. NPDC094447]|uniref:hypothetical protein n=1 Tax=Streptomyces sp. NPDC094447 TaxID=3366062 RepID=UPI0038227811
MWLGRRDSGAEKLDRCLSGEKAADAETEDLAQLAAVLSPRRPISESSRQRAFEAMMRRADRRANPVAGTAEEDLATPVIHVRTAQTGERGRLRVVDIEAVDDERVEEIAARVAERMREKSRDRT